MFPILSGNSASRAYNLTRSLRFRSSASASLTRTPASGTSQSRWTWSGWVKRGRLGVTQTLFSAYSASNYQTYINFTSSDTLQFNSFWGSDNENIITTQVFRDPSAWYHLVFAINLNASTYQNAVQMFVNGVQITAFSTTTFTNVFNAGAINGAFPHSIGSYATQSSNYVDLYLAELNFIDGQTLTPSSFGSTNATTGVWQPAAYTGTYGTNGFYLPFTDNSALTTSSNVGLGRDYSGNGNYWATNNISITAGATYDSMIDVPTLTSATVANFAVLNPINLSSSSSTSNANLLFTNSNGSQSWRSVSSTIAPTSGKWYWEGVFSGSTGGGGGGIFAMIGVFNPNNYFITNYTASTFWDLGYSYYADNGSKRILGAASSYGAVFNNGDVIGVALDLDSGTLTCYKNNVSQGVLASGISGPLTPAFANYDNASTLVVNFGQRPFTYTPPANHVALNTFNLPTGTILKGNTVMDATLYTGTGASLSVTNAAGFQPDLVWVKGRSGATDHAWYDSVRGTTKQLESNTTTAETTEATGLTAFGSAGFTVGALAQMNTNTATYVGWQWQAGQGSSSSNTNGTITSTVSVNATAGFSVVTYTGTGANATVGHGLGVAPSMVIVKIRSTLADWRVYHASTGATNVLYLNASNASTASSTDWNNTAPTSSVFSIGTSGGVNNSGSTYVAYCWSQIAGFSAFGKYTGNGSSDGPFIFTGFRPKFILIKRTESTANWGIKDTSRNPSNTATQTLFPSLALEEYSVYYDIDILSNGFKCRASDALINASGGTYIYACFAENPFKNSLAR